MKQVFYGAGCAGLLRFSVAEAEKLFGLNFGTFSFCTETTAIFTNRNVFSPFSPIIDINTGKQLLFFEIRSIIKMIFFYFKRKYFRA